MMACDGIWDCLSNQECVDKVKEIVDEDGMQEATDGLNKITEKLLDEILAPNTEDGIGTDNMTAIIIRLDKFNDHLK